MLLTVLPLLILISAILLLLMGLLASERVPQLRSLVRAGIGCMLALLVAIAIIVAMLFTLTYGTMPLW